jgi:hypothetical protein
MMCTSAIAMRMMRVVIAGRTWVYRVTRRIEKTSEPREETDVATTIRAAGNVSTTNIAPATLFWFWFPEEHKIFAERYR